MKWNSMHHAWCSPSSWLHTCTHTHLGNISCSCPLSLVRTNQVSAQVPLSHWIKKLTHSCSVTGQETIWGCTSAFSHGVWLPSLVTFFASLGETFGPKDRNAGNWRLHWWQHWLQQWLGVTALVLSVLRFTCGSGVVLIQDTCWVYGNHVCKHSYLSSGFCCFRS